MENLECEREVEVDGEGLLLLESHEDVYLLAIHSHSLLLVPNMLNAKKIRTPTRVIAI